MINKATSSRTSVLGLVVFQTIAAMIQRIQTLWLFLALLCSVLGFFFPLAIFETQNYGALEYNLIPEKLSADATVLPQLSVEWFGVIFTVVLGLLATVSIFLYRNRPLQLKITAVGFLLSVIYVALLFLYIVPSQENYFSSHSISMVKSVYALASYFPIAQVLFFMSAQRAIKKDEQLVRASERLR